MPYTLEELRNRPLSDTIHDVLDKTLPQVREGKPQITTASLLYAIASTPPTLQTASAIVAELFRTPLASNRFDSIVQPLGSADPAAEISPAVRQAFDEAFELRERTGGRDPFIGMRHLLFAIFTSSRPPLTKDVQELLSQLAINRRTAAEKIALFCLQYRESSEKVGVWNELLGSLGLPLQIKESSGKVVRSRSSKKRVTRAGAGALDSATVPRPPEVALLNADDPWSAAQRDHAGARSEAEAFAAMISARQFLPPLAVGVFGDWGSGKSFFMRMVHDALGARVDSPDDADEAGAISFTRQIVQIRFNAWHYAETNLWASLVDHIFTCLDRWAEQKQMTIAADAVFERLATARRLTAEAAEELVERRRDRAEAATRLEEAQRAVAEKRAVLEQRPATYLSAAWTAFANSGQLEELKAAANRLGLAEATENATAFTAAAAVLDGELSRWALLRSGMARTLAGPTVVLAIAAGTLLLPPLLTWLASEISPGMPPLATVLSGIFVPIGVALAVATRMTNTALDKLRRARAGFEAELLRQTEAERAGEEEARALLAERETIAGEAEERLRQATERAAEAARDYNLQNGKGRVLRFVRDRLASGDYARHLGFVATVRKDFQELSELMTAGDATVDTGAVRALHAHVEAILERAGDLLDASEKAKLRSTVVDPAAPPPQVFDRIVLYIDDLDRCPSNQVIKVLQAIHLLLTFPLFVVFVAVDVRWLRGALARQYGGQIAERDASAASAGDYLEKIFQIPYWVRPMGAEGTRAILDDRMGPPEAPSSPPPFPPRPPDLDAGAEKGAAPPPPAPPPPSPPPPPEPEPVRTVSLRLTREERAFINEVADILDGSPRRTLRFINTYRIVKASLPAAELYHLEQQGYPALLILLALNVAADDIYPEIVGVIDDAKDAPLQKLKYRFARSQIGKDTGDSRVRRSLALFEQGEGDEQDLCRYVKLVARYSFNPETRLVGAARGTEEQPPTIPDQV